MKKYFAVIFLFLLSLFAGACSRTYVTTQQGATYNEYKAKTNKKVVRKKKMINRRR